MRIDEPGRDGLALEVDNLRARLGKMLNVFVVADPENPAPLYGDGRGPSIGRVYGDDDAVLEDQIHKVSSWEYQMA